jgi:hypothetical protein
MSDPLGPIIEALSVIIELDPWKESPEMATATAKKDPFANAANAEGADTTAKTNGSGKDPFGQPAGGGGFPKVADLFGCLLLIKPIKVESVPDYQDRTKMRDQLTADVTVIDGPPEPYAGTEPNPYVGKTYNNMWLNNKTLVTAGEAALRDGTPAILGRLWRFPQTSEVKAGKYTDRHDLEAKEAEIQANWRPGMPAPEPPKIAWGLEKYTDEEAQMARDFLAAK